MGERERGRDRGEKGEREGGYLLDGVALSTALLEDLLTLGNVTHDVGSGKREGVSGSESVSQCSIGCGV